MGPVTGDGCDHWHGLLAMEVVDQIAPEDRVALGAHLDGCQACRDEHDDLVGLARILPAADPDHFDVGDVPFELQSAVLTRLRADARHDRRLRRSRYVLGTVAAGAVAVALIVGLTSASNAPSRGRTVALTGLAGVRASARLTSEPWGTAIHLQETGQPGGQVLTVSMRTTGGSWWAAGTYRTVTGRSVQVDLACGVPSSKITTIWVRDKAGRTVLRGYVA